jgi:hypothetical protein
MASPMPVPVFSATQDAGDRCPSFFQSPDPAARLTISVFAAPTVFSISAKTSKSRAASPVAIRAGSKSERLDLEILECLLEHRRLHANSFS